jgi:hypothetical protein
MGERKPGGADAGAKLDRVLARLSRHRCRQQNCVMSEAMPAARLQQAQSAAQDRIVGQF